LAKISKKHNIVIIADEIYAELDFTGEYKSITHYYPEKQLSAVGLVSGVVLVGGDLERYFFQKD
jgi:hypothetical protein